MLSLTGVITYLKTPRESNGGKKYSENNMRIQKINRKYYKESKILSISNLIQ